MYSAQMIGLIVFLDRSIQRVNPVVWPVGLVILTQFDINNELNRCLHHAPRVVIRCCSCMAIYGGFQGTQMRRQATVVGIHHGTGSWHFHNNTKTLQVMRMVSVSHQTDPSLETCQDMLYKVFCTK